MPTTIIPYTETESVFLTDAGHFGFIDSADAPLIVSYEWYFARGYAKSSAGFMHRILLGNPPSDIDHANGYGLDNRRCNLRPCTDSQNQANRITKQHSSAYRGVSLVKKTGRWRAQLSVNQKYINIGYFGTEIEAARAYDAAATQHFGEFARLNFPSGSSQ